MIMKIESHELRLGWQQDQSWITVRNVKQKIIDSGEFRSAFYLDSNIETDDEIFKSDIIDELYQATE